MCDACGESKPARSVRGRRLKIDEIDSQWHCAIIGTCLTLGDLRAVAAKLKIKVEPGPGGYQLHASMVHWSSQNRPVSKAITKLLDRRHFLAIKQFARAEGDEELVRLWTESLEKGEVAGACWAIMSHGGASEDLRQRVFQEIHMLSHRVGAASRADLRMIHVLETEKAELEAKVARQQERLRQEIKSRDEEIRTLRRRLDLEEAETRRLAYAAGAAGELDGLRGALADLRLRLEMETDRRRRTGEEMREAQSALAALREGIAKMSVENGRLEEENRMCEARLENRLTPFDCQGECDGSCGRLDLCGRCVLFVGGRNQHLPHLRRLVEESNGVFSHHDGGVEQNMARLHGLLGRADAVLFPVDCVSHSAQDAVKQLCRQWRKPYVPVRHAGLGAYLSALTELTADSALGKK